jgi:rubrerythrin
MKKYLPQFIVGGILVAALVGILSFDAITANDQAQSTNEWYGQNAIQDVYSRRGGMMGSRLPQLSTSLEGTDVDEAELQAMLDVLYLDELNAKAEYEALVEVFGDQSPYTQLILAETRHADALLRLYDLYDLEVPTVQVNTPVVPATLEETYAIGIDAEVANIALYDNYLDLNLPDLVERVFSNLQRASENHLRIFTAYDEGTEDQLPLGTCHEGLSEPRTRGFRGGY